MSEETVTQGAEHSENAGVGPLLRASRQRVGEELRDVAEMLRIRYPYLEAIEDGRFKDLPGQTYAVGFVRAYAEHLGLDSEEVVRRYKIEVEAGGARHDLHFPTPVAETGFPGGAIVFVGLVVAVLAYGGWYLSTTKDGFFSDLVAPLPERLAALVDGGSDEAAKPAEPLADKADAGPATEETATPPPEPKPTSESAEKPQSETVAESATSPEQPTASEETSTDAPALATQTVAAAPEAAAPAAETETTSPASAETAPETAPETTPENAGETAPEAVPAPAATEAASTTATGAAPSAAQAAHETVAQAVSEAAAEAPARTETETTAPPPAPVVETPAAAPTETASTETQQPAAPAAAEPASRIVVHATANSWIEVRDDFSNTMLVSRLLKAGERYAVPDKTGLSLHTGNAGALEILVDGEAVPPIGAGGAVLRGVQLDPDLLKSGDAAQ